MEQVDSEALENEEYMAVGVLADKFLAPPSVIIDTRVDYIEFLQYMQTLANPFNSSITLNGAVELFENNFYVIQR